MRNGQGTFEAALNEAFRRTGVDRSEFVVTKTMKMPDGTEAPTEWRAPGFAEVNIDNPVAAPNRGVGPQVPHVGYQTPGKAATKYRGTY